MPFMNYELYDSIMIKQFVLSAVFFIVALLVGILGWMYANDRKKRGDNGYVLYILAAIAIICAIFLGGYAVSYLHDMINHSYIVYEGNFLVSNHAVNDKSTPSIYLLDKNNLQVDIGASKYYDFDLSAETYTGKLVYASKSKYVVDILSVVKCEE